MSFPSSFKSKLIYVFRINDKIHKGLLKIGETSIYTNIDLKPNSKELNEAAKDRINQYTQTAGITYELLYTELAVYTKEKSKLSFSDKDVHSVLIRSGISREFFDKEKKANEWFKVDLETTKNAIKAVKEGRSSLNSNQKSESKSPIIFRPDQNDAIQQTVKKFKKSNRMLWNAKMRFGKTLCGIQVTKIFSFNRTLILTHRPVVNESWFKDFDKIFYDSNDYSYGSKKKGEKIEKLEIDCKKSNGKKKYIYFASLQDLRGSESVGGNFDKNDLLFSINWDFIIVDEAHEGTKTELGLKVLKLLKKKNTKVLELSGTPFNLLDNYSEDEIFTWDYVMEQKAKQDWDKYNFGDPNPYSSLPRLNIYTYDLGQLIDKYIEDDYAFNFFEFFSVQNDGKFKHENDILKFLNLITQKDGDSNYPFSTQEYRDNFRHTLWMLPGVKAAKALSKLLNSHKVFEYYKIVNVAGDGDKDEEKPFNDALKAVKAAW